MSPGREQLLERDGEMNAVARAVESVTAGGSSFLTVEGAAGMGKTRVLAEIRNRAEAEGMRVLSARGSEMERDFAFGVVRQLFEPLLSADAATMRTELSGAASAAARVFDPPSADRVQNGDFASLHGLFWLTVNVSQRQPIAVVIDDLQWADESSLRFLGYLLPRLDGLRILLAIGLRPRELSASALHVAGDPSAVRLPLAPLSPAAGARLLAEAVGNDPDPAFCAAAHTATAGNPLLLHELVHVLLERGLTPTRDNSEQLAQLGNDVIGHRIDLWLARLPQVSTALASAVAILGGDTTLTLAGALAEVDTATAEKAIDSLVDADLFMDDPTQPDRLRFVHPLVSYAVYQRLAVSERAAGHRAAGGLLLARSAPAEHIAAHVLRTTPGTVPDALAVLNRAADDALSRGAPHAAAVYLTRCLEEPAEGASRINLLTRLGSTAALFDLGAAASNLRRAFDLAADARTRAVIADRLGQVLVYLARYAEAYEVFHTGLSQLGDAEEDLRNRLTAGVLSLPVLSPGWDQVLAMVPALRERRWDDSLGSRALDAVIAMHETFVCDPAAVPRARRALSDGILVEHLNGGSPVTNAWLTLLAADDDGVMDFLDNAIAQAHLHGSLLASGTAHWCRGVGWLWRGQLSEAAANFLESAQEWELAGVRTGRPYVSAYTAQTLVEQGRLAEAAEVLEKVPAEYRATYLVQECLAQLLRLQGNPRGALAAAQAAGDLFGAHGGRNPALVTWRSEAVLCLLELGECEQARELAGVEVDAARRWGAPRALGRALRIAAAAEPTRASDLLEESVAVLEDSNARLELGKSLLEYGSRLRRVDRRREAKEPLLRARTLARRAGAVALAEAADTELRLSGARPRGDALQGVPSLTPSELRIAEMAARGTSNREIAQSLFVTPKTVEVHLSSVYRKLGITSRRQLGGALTVTTVR